MNLTNLEPPVPYAHMLFTQQLLLITKLGIHKCGIILIGWVRIVLHAHVGQVRVGCHVGLHKSNGLYRREIERSFV